MYYNPKKILKLFHKQIILKHLFLPLNLETYLICKKSRLETVNFDLLLDNKFHKDALVTSLNFSKLIKFNSKLNFSFKYEIISFLRHRLYCVIF